MVCPRLLVVIPFAAACAASPGIPRDAESAPSGDLAPLPSWAAGAGAARTTESLPAGAPDRFATRTIAERPEPESRLYDRGRPGRRIDLDLKEADIADVCRLLADTGHVNIVLADDVQAKVTVRMRQVPWDQALEAILRTRGFRAERDGNIISVFAK